MNKQAKLKQDQDVAKDDLTIILSYPHVYRFKPICYGMIVAGLREAFAGVWGCLSAVLDAFLCPVFASFPAKKVVLYLNASVLSMVII